MMTEPEDQLMYENVSIQLKTPDGEATIIIAENASGEIYNIQMFIGKCGSSLSAWCNALAKMTTFSLKHIPLDTVIAELEDISSDRYASKDGVTIRSGPEALSMALQRYKFIRRI